MKRKRKSTTRAKARKPAKRRKVARKTGAAKMTGLKKARLKKTIASLKTCIKHLEKEIR